MTMCEESLRVVAIQHASSSSRDVNTMAIKWALQALSLGPTDELTLLVILRPLHSSTIFPFIPSAKYQQRSVEEDIAKRKKDYQNNAEIMKISEQCETDQIVFRIEVLGDPFPEIAVNTAISLKATIVILDRHMRKYKKYFMESLSCGILLMKRNNSIQHLKGPTDQTRLSGRGNAIFVSCSKSSFCKQLSENPSFCPLNSTRKGKSTSLQSRAEQNPANRELDMARGYCLLPFTDHNTQETDHTEIYTRTMSEQKKKPRLNHEEVKDSVCSQCNNKRPKFVVQRDFTYAELHAATKRFSPMNFLSEGGFGSVYKGELNELKIAVKQHRCASLQGEKEFKSEVNVLSKARHENVVMLLGSCSDGDNRLLVYEYVCNGSLDQHLSPYSRKPLSWQDRIKVALGAARGLQYLHENNIIHRDMRPNNILVTHDYEALLGDFGLARLSLGGSLYSTDVVGTMGYLAPEYAESGKPSTKTDVYSFGVVLLQLITGMRITDKRLGDKSLVGWARPLLKERNYPDLIDERMMDTHDCHQLFWLIRLAEKCLSRDPRKRLAMDTVVDALSQIVEGSTCSLVLKDCSDSIYDMSDSGDESEGSMHGSRESQGDDDDDDEDNDIDDNDDDEDDYDDDGSLYGTSISRSISPHMSTRLPPSPPLMGTSCSTTSSSMMSVDQDNDESTFDDLTSNEKNMKNF